MHMLVKGTFVTASILAALWIGHMFPVATGQAKQTEAVITIKQQPQSGAIPQKILEQLNSRLAALEKERHSLSTLSRRLEQLEATQRSLSQSLAEAGGTQDEPLHTVPDPEDTLGAPQETVKKAQDIISHYEGVFWNERRDATWSTETEMRLAQAWDKETLKGSHLLMVACQNSLCRLEVGHDSEAAREQFMANLALLMPFDTEGISYPLMDAEERVGTVVYLARPGYPLPSGLTP